MTLEQAGLVLGVWNETARSQNKDRNREKRLAAMRSKRR
jgi:hypothetical protein